MQPSPEPVTPGLIGRDCDGAVLQQFSRTVAHRGGVLIVDGVPGVGKTALLGAATVEAEGRGISVVAAGGVHSERHVRFSLLEQLLRPLQDDVRRLPTEDRLTLAGVLRLDPRCEQSTGSVATALARLFRHAVAGGPVMLTVDDIQWADQPSADALRLTAMSIHQPGLGLLVTERSDAPAAFLRARVPRHHLQPLPRAAAEALVLSRFPDTAEGVLLRIVEESQGLPLALLELPAALSAAQRTTATSVPQRLPLTPRLVSLFSEAVDGLSPATRQALILVALHPGAAIGAPLLSTLGDEVMLPAVRAGLITIDRRIGQIAFRYPLARDAVIELSTVRERRDAHRTLASLLTPEDEGVLWHVAAASTAPDEVIAVSLEQEAHELRSRGSVGDTVSALLAAANLSAERVRKAERLAQAAYVHASVTGDCHQAWQLLWKARELDANSHRRLPAATATACLLLNEHGDVASAHRTLVTALEIAPDWQLTSRLGADAVMALLQICLVGAHPRLWPAFQAVIDRTDMKSLLTLQLSATMLVDPVRTAAPRLADLDEALRALDAESDSAQVIRMATAATYVDRIESARPRLLRVIADERKGGSIPGAIVASALLALDSFQTGHWAEADGLAADALTLNQASGCRLLDWPLKFVQALLAAGQGNDARVIALCEEMVAWAAPRDAGAVRRYAWHAEGLAALGRGDFDIARMKLSAVSAPGRLAPYNGHALLVVMDMVEAAVNAGRSAEAAAHVRAIKTANVGNLSARAALLVSGAEAMAAPELHRHLYERALSLPTADRWPFEMARIHLHYGQRLRRGRAATDARRHLQIATDTFDHLHAEEWAARSRAEIQATSPTNARRARVGPDALTPQELSTARLAAAGLSNKRIADQLLISHRTVGAHLSQVFTKLGISTRAALAEALAGSPR